MTLIFASFLFPVGCDAGAGSEPAPRILHQQCQVYEVMLLWTTDPAAVRRWGHARRAHSPVTHERWPLFALLLVLAREGLYYTEHEDQKEGERIRGVS